MALIKCEECGQMVSDKAEQCQNCGCPVVRKTVCEECGKEMKATDNVCPTCGCPNPSFATQSQQPKGAQNQGANYSDTGTSGKSRLLFALFAFFLGGLGVHFFYIGKTGAGILNILSLTIGWLLIIPPIVVCAFALIQGIMTLCATQEEFERRYVYSEKFYPF